MAIIQVLPEILANKIAAGEVIERPASIVKELIENSLDAGASSIDVTIKHGGKSLIRVADNGSGMGRDDVELAFQRHATSKIKTDADLDHILSFGFRGEALPSVGAVSRTKVLTRTADEEIGTELIIEGGKLISIRGTSCRVGTIVEVRDLFFNTPARRKFLRTDSTEKRHVVMAVGRMALALGKVQFSLIAGESKLWEFSATEGLLERAALVLESNNSNGLIPIAAEGKGVRLSGLIGKPHSARANRSGQIFFVNRRWVKAMPLGFALQDAYHGLLMHGQYPLAVLFIEVDPEQVDVNVHPTKQEVRLSNEREVKRLIRETVEDRLKKEEDLAPHLKAPAWPIASYGAGGTRLTSIDTQSKQWQAPELETFPAPAREQALAEPIALRNKLKITKILGQIHNTYLITETEDGFMLIDQHAAHERVMYEDLLSDFESGLPRKQGLLLNEVLKLTPRQQEPFEQSLSLLSKVGFEIEHFGNNEFVIRTVPATLRDVDPVACIQHFIEQRSADQGHTDLENHQQEVAALIACKRKSVKASDALTPEKIQALMENLARCENPFNCPHGRPAFFQYSMADLEKQFKRKL